MADRVLLKAQKRELLGKKVGRLRREGILPATVYGHQVKPESIQVGAHEFRDVMRRAGTTQLVDLVIENQRPRAVLIRQLGRNAKKNSILHVEFFQANLREKITTHVPLHIVGESPAVREGGILLQVLDHVDIESLPQDVPAGGAEVDISRITEINGAIHAGEISLPAGVTLVTAPDEVAVKVNPPVAAEVVEEAEAEAVPEEAAAEVEEAPEPESEE